MVDVPLAGLLRAHELASQKVRFSCSAYQLGRWGLAWRPSTDPDIQRADPTRLWTAIEQLFDEAAPARPLPRGEILSLRRHYVRERKRDNPNVRELQSRLPDSLLEFGLGPTDIELLDFILNYQHDRVLRVIGPRGAGKTSLLHFAEAALRFAGLDPEPQLVLLDGLLVPTDGTRADFVDLLQREIHQRARTVAPALRGAFRHCARLLKAPRARSDGVQEALYRLAMALPDREHRLVTLVFDNLDHHKPVIIETALELAKEIYVTSNIGSIVCLRHGASGGASRVSAARAFFGFEINLFTPRADAWLPALQARIREAAERREKAGGTSLTAYDITLTPRILSDVFSRFAALLIKGRADDNALAVLEAASANDTRHLIELVRRILSNRLLPDRWLLGQVTEEPSFHALRSMVEGPMTIYHHSAAVPNLLCYGNGQANSELLLQHRILTLVGSSEHPVESARLTTWLGVFGYDVDTVTDVLGVLCKSHLVGATDAETVSRDEPLPGAFFLTEAGHYYLQHFLRRADYLTTAVLDVPLEHRDVRHHSPEHFSVRLRSLLEYAEEVRYREDRQIAALATRTPSSELRRCAEAISKGGLLTATIVDGLTETLARGRVSEVREVQAALREAEDVEAGLRRWLHGAEKRLAEVVNRGRRAMTQPSSPIYRREAGVELRANVTRVGDDLQLRIAMKSREQLTAAIVWTRTRESSPGFSCSFPIATTEPSDGAVQVPGHTLQGASPDISVPEELRTDDLSVQVVAIPAALGRPALLTADEEQGRLRVRIYVLTGRRVDMHDLGSGVAVDAVVRQSREWLNSISTLIAAGEPFEERTRVIGTQLARLCLSEVGQNIIGSYYSLVDSCLVFCAHPEIPWELLTPPPTPAVLPHIGDLWRIVRSSSDPLSAALGLTIPDASIASGRLRTVGREAASALSHVSNEPRSLGSLCECASLCDTLHLIGHWSEEGSLSLRQSQLSVSAPDVDAYPLEGPGSIILSACGSGAVERSSSLPIALSLRAQKSRHVWAPLVRISYEQALAVDDGLAEFTRNHPQGTIEEFMLSARKKLPILRVYVRYALKRT